jgi:hypothetical protein
MFHTFNPFAAWFFNPKHRDVLRKQLDKALLDRADHAQAREYHAAMESMLDKRIARLERELGKLENVK